MTKDFYRSLDRPINIFGLKGEWVRYFFYLAGASLVLAFLVGSVSGVGMGFAVFLVGGIGSFFACLIFQGRLPSRCIAKARIRSKMRLRVVRRESLAKILLGDPREKTIVYHDVLK